MCAELDLDAAVRDALDHLETLRPALYVLTRHLDRQLVTTEGFVASDRARNPVAERLIESLNEASAVSPTRWSTSVPHMVVGEFEVRVIKMIDRRLHISTDTAANRVLVRGLESIVTELNRALRHDALALHLRARARKLRSAYIQLRQRVDTDGMGLMRPADLMDRSLRYAPRYRPVLELHRAARTLRQARRPDDAPGAD